MATGIARYDAPADVGEALRTLGEDIAMARRRRCLSMEEAAGLAGVSRATWARLEHGDPGGPGVSLGILGAALGALGLLSLLAGAVDPARDRAGAELERERLQRGVRARVLPRRSRAG